MSENQPTNRFSIRIYQRPNQTWICGRSSEGMPCTLGPTKSGECGGKCEPYLDGERYYCSNSSELMGQCADGPLPDGSCCQFPAQCTPAKKNDSWVCRRGACESGPLPDGSCCGQFGSCRPIKSILGKRKKVVLAVSSLAIAGLLVILAGPSRNNLISPGELTSHHQATQDDCASCHTVGGQQFNDWVHLAFSPKAGESQSQLCLECHVEIGENAMNAHSFSQNDLAAITKAESSDQQNTDEPYLLNIARIGKPKDSDKISCATCHHEHRGKLHNLNTMTDIQCQICHVKAFHSFEDGHPEFSDYPYKRRTNLYFDHTSHFGRHYKEYSRFKPDESLEFSCRDCHTQDSNSNTILVNSFEQSCAKCHDQQINTENTPGIAFFSVPALDIESLKQSSHDIGIWPETFPFHIESHSKITPFTRFILSGHVEFNNAILEVEDLDLADLEGLNEESLKKVENFVWEFKKAFYALIINGREKFEDYLSNSLGFNTTELKVGSSLLYDQLIAAQETWLPTLEEELKAREESKETETEEKNPSEIAVEQKNSQIDLVSDWIQQEKSRIRNVRFGWFRRDSDLSIYYRPKGHSDAWMKIWLDASARIGGITPNSHSSSMKQIFENLSSPTAAGRCMKCHTAEPNKNGFRVHWFANKQSTSKREFTKFSHRPHLILLGDDNCQECHKFEETTSSGKESNIFRSEFIKKDWRINVNYSDYHSEFAKIKISDCARCHSSSRAENSCLTCHNYHITAED